MNLKQFKMQHHAGGTDYFNYPSGFALRVWFYVRAIGKSRHDPSFRMLHRNEDGFLLHFLKRGALWHRIGESTHVARAGEACLFELSKEVRYGIEGNRQAELYWVWFDGKDMPLVFRELHADFDPVFHSLDPARMAALFQELLRLTRRQPTGYESRASGTLTLLLSELHASRCILPRPVDAGDETRPLSDPVRRAIQYITRNYERSILTVKQMALAAAHQSLFHFSRQFHREVGVTPSAYLNQFRIDQAKRLLETTARPIEEIARCVGYRDQGYFARVFTRLLGMSPRQYRRKVQRAPTAKRKR